MILRPSPRHRRILYALALCALGIGRTATASMPLNPVVDVQTAKVLVNSTPHLSSADPVADTKYAADIIQGRIAGLPPTPLKTLLASAIAAKYWPAFEVLGDCVTVSTFCGPMSQREGYAYYSLASLHAKQGDTNVLNKFIAIADKLLPSERTAAEVKISRISRLMDSQDHESAEALAMLLGAKIDNGAAPSIKDQAQLATASKVPGVSANLTPEPEVEVPPTVPNPAPVSSEAPVQEVIASSSLRYAVQVASFPSADLAAEYLRELKRALPHSIMGEQAQIAEVELSGRGSWHRIYAARYADYRQAQQHCAQFAAAKRDCLVIRTK